MDVPDDNIVLGESDGMKTGRGLDDMLMERALRFYDPRVRNSRCLFFFSSSFGVRGDLFIQHKRGAAVAVVVVVLF